MCFLSTEIQTLQIVPCNVCPVSESSQDLPAASAGVVSQLGDASSTALVDVWLNLSLPASDNVRRQSSQTSLHIHYGIPQPLYTAIPMMYVDICTHIIKDSARPFQLAFCSSPP